MRPETGFAINEQRFAHETVDEEVIVIDMDEGNYFSMRDTAAVIWGLVAQGVSFGGVVTALAAATDLSSADVSAAVQPFLQRLVDEGMLASNGETARRGEAPALAAFAFAPPVMDKYTEMQDLLTLDPIHEVDESGWPRRAEVAGD